MKYSRELIAQLINVYYTGKSIPQIAREFNLPVNMIRKRTYGKLNKRPYSEYQNKNNHSNFLNLITYGEKGCCEWNGSLNNKGYGQFSIDNAVQLCHRYSYSLYKGDCKGKFVCHSCDNPKCVNPDHLFLGNYKVNSMDKMHKDRTNKATLTNKQVREARVLIKAGKKNDEIALIFNVKPDTIKRIR